MSSWENGNLPTFSEWATEEYIVELDAKAKMWQKRAERLQREIENISASIKDRGYWLCPDTRGGHIKLVPAESAPPTP